nr:MerR family DNA-binding protein [Oleiagrimonas sp. C23AA]
MIQSRRNAGNQHRYRCNVLHRLAVIRAAQSVGLDLARMDDMLAGLPNGRIPARDDWQKLSQQWRQLLDWTHDGASPPARYI